MIFHYPQDSKLVWYRAETGKELERGYYWCQPLLGAIQGPHGPYKSWYDTEAAMKKGERKVSHGR